jgi:FkbM family methyltransferase
MRHLIRLFKAINSLGPLHGFIAYFYYIRHRIHNKWETRQMFIPCLQRRIWLRPGVSDWIVLERIFMDREYDSTSTLHEEGMLSLQESIVASGKTPLIVDCGANIGLASLWFADRFKQSTVIAVEPEPNNYSLLELNSKDHPRILPFNAAISDRPSMLGLINQGDTPWAWETQESEVGQVQALTIPHLLNTNPQYVLFIVKVDIEGFETNLFRSRTGWVDQLPLMVFEMHDWRTPWSGSGHSFFSTLTRGKRDYIVRGENIFSYGQRGDAVQADLDSRATLALCNAASEPLTIGSGSTASHATNRRTS